MLTCVWCDAHLSGRKKRFCSSRCNNIFKVTAWRRRTKRRAVEYKGGKCAGCGYSKCPAAMVFHHSGGKTFGISKGGTTRSWDAIRKELDKCTMLCLNCHAEEHFDWEWEERYGAS